MNYEALVRPLFAVRDKMIGGQNVGTCEGCKVERPRWPTGYCSWCLTGFLPPESEVACLWCNKKGKWLVSVPSINLKDMVRDRGDDGVLTLEGTELLDEIKARGSTFACNGCLKELEAK